MDIPWYEVVPNGMGIWHPFGIEKGGRWGLPLPRIQLE